jgi:hypothetical protein
MRHIHLKIFNMTTGRGSMGGRQWGDMTPILVLTIRRPVLSGSGLNSDLIL